MGDQVEIKDKGFTGSVAHTSNLSYSGNKAEGSQVLARPQQLGKTLSQNKRKELGM